MTLSVIPRLLIYSYQGENMNLFGIDFDELLLTNFYYFKSEKDFPDVRISELISQADEVISNKTEIRQRKAEAYLVKFQLMSYQYKLAPKFLKEALKLCPNMPQALIRKGIFYYLKEGNNVKMLEYINRALEKDPIYACAWMIRGYSLHIYNSKQAITYFEKYIKLIPDSPLGYIKYADCLKNNLPYIAYMDMKPDKEIIQNIKEAIYNYSKAICLKSSDIEIYHDRAELYLLLYLFNKKEQDKNKSLSDLTKYLVELPINGDIEHLQIITKSFFHYINKSVKEKYLLDMLKIVSKNTDLYWCIYNELADCYSDQNYFTKANIIFTKMINKKNSGSIWQILGYYGRASVYNKNKKYEKALNDYASIIKHGSWINENLFSKIPYDISLDNVYKQRADIYKYRIWDYCYNIEENIELNKKAIEEYSKAIEISKIGSRLGSHYRERAKLHMEIEEYNNAIDDYTAIIDLHNKKKSSYYVKEAYEERSKLYLKQGNREKAFEDFVRMSEVENEEQYDDSFNVSVGNLITEKKEFEIIK